MLIFFSLKSVGEKEKEPKKQEQMMWIDNAWLSKKLASI